MNITFSFELSSSKTSEKEQSILIRLTQNRKLKRISTGITVNQKFWNRDKQVIKSNHPLSVEYNKIISEKIKRITSIYARLLEASDAVGIDDVTRELFKDVTTNFYDFAYNTKLTDIRNRNKMGTYRRYEAVLNKLKEYAGSNLSVKAITYSFLRDYEKYLRSKLNNSQDTVSANMSVIRSIINEAIRHGTYTNSNPFDQIHLKYTDNTKEKLTAEELFKMIHTPLPKTRSLLLARDFFLACFLAEGTRGGDMVVMMHDNIINNCLVYNQQKTGKQMVIPITPALQKIIESNRNESRFIFPLLTHIKEVNERSINSKLTYINKYLKEVCKYCGIFKKITTHCARHTFTDLALHVSNGNIYEVQQSLGHSSVKTTEIYGRQRVNYQKTSLLPDILMLVDSSINKPD